MDNQDPSPVVIIKQKELELAERLAAARQASDRAILEARQWATDYHDRSEREGQEKATVFFRAELESSDAEAEKVRVEGELAARWIAETGSRSLEKAVESILQTILPTLSRVNPGVDSLDPLDLQDRRGSPTFPVMTIEEGS